MVRTVDTDIVVLVVLTVANYHIMVDIEQLWIAFGTGKDFRYIPVHELAKTIGPHMAKACHVFTHSRDVTLLCTLPNMARNQLGTRG
jgi:hypothetical protein